MFIHFVHVSTQKHVEWLADLMINVEMLRFYEFDQRIKKLLSTTEFTAATHNLAEHYSKEETLKHLNV